MKGTGMMDKTLVEALAAELRAAEVDRAPIPAIRSRMSDDDGAAAYAVQAANVAHAVESGRRIVGRKIGLTAKAVQAQLGVDQPDFGTLFGDMIFGDDDAIPVARTLQPKAEAEVALVLAKDLPQKDVTLQELISAVDYAFPAIDVVGS